MPARGDHEQRRQQVAQVAADLIATGGLAAATHRNIARAADCSTTVVSHYFADKRDLVEVTYRHVGERVAARMEKAAQARTDPVLATLEALLPLDDARRHDWRLLLAFLGVAATDAELSLEQRTRVATARDRIAEVIGAAHERDPARCGGDPAVAAEKLLALVLGIGMQALFDPGHWPPARMRRVLREALARELVSAPG